MSPESCGETWNNSLHTGARGDVPFKWPMHFRVATGAESASAIVHVNIHAQEIIPVGLNITFGSL